MSLSRKYNEIVNFISAQKDFDPNTNSFSISKCYPNGKPVRLKLIRTSEALYITDNGEFATYIMQELLSSSSVVARLRTQNLLKGLTRRTPISANGTELRSNVTYFNTRNDLANEIAYFENAYATIFEAQSAMLKDLARETAMAEEQAISNRVLSPRNGDHKDYQTTVLHAA